MNKNSANDTSLKERRTKKNRKGFPIAKATDFSKCDSVALSKRDNSGVDLTKGGKSGGEKGRQRQNQKR